MGFFDFLFGKKKKEKEEEEESFSDSLDSLFGKEEEEEEEGEESKPTNPVANTYSDLTLLQRNAIMGLLLYFRKFSMGRPSGSEADKILYFKADALNLDIHSAMDYVATYLRTREQLLNALSSIDKNLLDVTVYDCFGMCAISNNPEAFNAMEGMFNDLGYSNEDIVGIIKKAEALGQMFNH